MVPLSGVFATVSVPDATDVFPECWFLAGLAWDRERLDVVRFSPTALLSSGGFCGSVAASVEWNVGTTIITIAVAASQKRFRRESVVPVWLAETSLVSRRRQKLLNCGLPPRSIIVAQGPYWLDITLLLSGVFRL